ncbi:hypothetical protein GCM10023149_47970 [Mucilaginibacter gynuensis]|uniref:VOC domain-containing protein n=1 Tax=Mucilaginibacter gynuensis TaxID=1302236 RepID=A0ABP8HEQ6_9SPHI
MKLRYIPVHAGKFEEQISFYTEKLGFKIVDDKPLYEDGSCVILEAENHDVLLAVSKQNPDNSFENCIVLNTDDCLNDHHQLKTAGIEFSREPEYLPIGLVAEFLDPCGNKFLLVEERDYTDY